MYSSEAARGEANNTKATKNTDASAEANLYFVDDAAQQPEDSRRWFAMTPAQQRAYLEENFAARVQCVRDKGWKISVSDPAQFVIDTGLGAEEKSQLEALNADEKECFASNPSIADNLTYTRKDIAAEYEKKLNLAACLNERGVKTKQPPTVDKWVEDFIGTHTTGNPQTIWDPYEAFQYPENMKISAGKFTQIMRECPNV